VSNQNASFIRKMKGGTYRTYSNKKKNFNYKLHRGTQSLILLIPKPRDLNFWNEAKYTNQTRN